MRQHNDHDTHDHDLGLQHDLDTLMRQRRQALGWLAGLGGMALVGCGGGGETASTSSSTASSSSSSSGSTTTTTTTGTVSSCSVIPEETAGPYPGDGSNSNGSGIANALTLSGIVRSDIRTSVGSASGTASGVPLTITLRLVNTSSSCADLSGYAIYLWHCDAQGRYSMYSSAVIAQNYLRGVQATASDGTVSFTTIVPGCYSGRMPHMHFEVYRSTSTASSYTNKLKTSQIAFPTDIVKAIYTSESSTYSGSLSNLNAISFSTDNIFSDGYSTQLASMSGSISAGYTASLVVGISA